MEAKWNILTDQDQAPLGHLSREQKNQILRKRAIALAKRPIEEDNEEQRLEVVEFQLDQQRYAIEIEFIREICLLKALTPLPFVPVFVLGVINIRGQVLSIVDLKKFFNLPDRGLTDLNKVIILKFEQMEFGVLANTIIGVKTLLTKSLQARPDTLTGIQSQYLKGITNDRLVVLDALKILSDKQIIVHEEIK
ncbi:MAG: purine-binding chemotaxis protein CheW [SAR324 cluster bacterium]|nr:purine-binding chemotaxis protein CheW [SAR324 cluster bacterium]